MGGLNQNKTPEPVEGNPFEFLKELVDGESEDKLHVNDPRGDKNIHNSELSVEKSNDDSVLSVEEEKARNEELTKMIFPHDIEGVKEIFADPDLKKIDSLYLGRIINKVDLLNETICENRGLYSSGKAIRYLLPPTLDKNYEAGTQYRFILELGAFNFLFEDQSQPSIISAKLANNPKWEDKDIKLKPELDGEGLLSINLETQITKTYYTGSLYATFFSKIKKYPNFYSTRKNNNQCVVRQLDSYWYDSNKVKLIKRTRDRKPEDHFRELYVPYEFVNISFLGKTDRVVQSELSLHEAIMNSKSEAKNEPLNIYCPSCEEKKEYVINVNIKAYKQKYTKRIKEAADIEKREKERILNRTLAPMRKQCEELGFKKGTKSFKDCVVELM